MAKWWEYTLAGAGTNMLKDMLADKKVMPEALPEDPALTKLRSTTTSQMQDVLDKGVQPYTGELVAPMSDIEKSSLQKLKAWSEQPDVQPVMQAGADEVAKTLASSYDPETSAYFQAFRNQRLKDLSESTSNLNEELAGSGRYFHGGRATAVEDLVEQANRDITSQNAAMAETERQRKLDVLPFSMQFGEALQKAPVEKVAAMQQYGGLDRQIQQALDSANYAEALRLIEQKRKDIGQGSEIAGQPNYAYPSYQPSTLMQLIQALAPAVGSAAGAAAAACHVAEVLYGPDDERTRLARLYTATHDSEFVRAYKRYSRAWAKWFQEHPSLQSFFEPVWSYMWKRAQIMELCK